MKIVAKPIKMIAVFEYDDKPPRPYKFKMREESEEEITVVVDQVFDCSKEKKAGIESLVYKCQSIINGMDCRYELKYIIASCRWQLYKI